MKMAKIIYALALVLAVGVAPTAWAKAQASASPPPTATDGALKGGPESAASDPLAARARCRSSLIVTKDQVVVTATRECVSVVVSDGEVVVTASGVTPTATPAIETAGYAPASKMSAP